MAGVTGVFMTLALILMVSSATELIRYELLVCNQLHSVCSISSPGKSINVWVTESCEKGMYFQRIKMQNNQKSKK